MKESMCLVEGKWTSAELHNHKPKMSKEDTCDYYTKKISKEFKRLGYIAKKTSIHAKETAIAISNYRREGFDSIDDYYDYYEAKKMKIKLGVQ